MAQKENKEIKKAMEIIDEMSMDEKEWELYESRQRAILDYNTGILEAREDGMAKGLEQGLQQGLEQGKKLGLEEGSKKKQLEIAKKLLDKKMSIEEIAEITGLDISIIKNLAEDMK
mgnify:CR=1 FL=1